MAFIWFHVVSLRRYWSIQCEAIFSHLSAHNIQLTCCLNCFMAISDVYNSMWVPTVMPKQNGPSRANIKLRWGLATSRSLRIFLQHYAQYWWILITQKLWPFKRFYVEIKSMIATLFHYFSFHTWVCIPNPNLL